jgi:heme/copper-type cytochrome/quinol oxidase subunit 2
MRQPATRRAASSSLLLSTAMLAVLALATWTIAQEESRHFAVAARKYTFDPAVIEVRHNDLVKITLRADDIAHSFTIDDYRIDKRASAGHSTTFEFRAHTVGTFPFYCNLRSDSGCRQMRVKLIVRPR